MRQVISIIIERLLGYALFTFAMAAMVFGAVVLMLILNTTFSHWAKHMPDNGFMAKPHKAR